MCLNRRKRSPEDIARLLHSMSVNRLADEYGVTPDDIESCLPKKRTVPASLMVSYNMTYANVIKMMADIASALGVSVEELERRLEDESNLAHRRYYPQERKETERW